MNESANLDRKVEESELRLKVAVEAAAIGTFDWDIKQNTFQYSERLAQIFGYEETEGLRQNSFADRIHPSDQAMRMAAHKTAFSTGHLFYEARIIWPDQSIRWVRLNGKVLYDTNKDPERMYGTTLDITKEKTEAERMETLIQARTKKLEQKIVELRESEERYHKMVEEVEDYAIILLSRDGVIRNWNKGAEKIKRYHESEILGEHFSIFYLPEDRATHLPQRLIDQASQTGKATHEGWRVRKDGTKFWGSISITALHNDQGEVIGFSKVTRDLTEKKLAEDQLRNTATQLAIRNEALIKSEERYNKMIAEVQDYAIILLSVEGDIENWNAGAERIKGYSSSEIIGKNFKIFYTKEDLATGLPMRLLNEAKKYDKATHEGWRVRKDGSRFWGSIAITALHDNDGNVIGFSKVTRDLTERKEAEDQLIKYTNELELQNKELEQFAYVASHDLQEPLRKIQTFTEIIERNIKNEELVIRYFEKINASAYRMSMLIKSVLNYSRLLKDDEESTVVNLNAVLKNVLEDLEVLILEKSATIEITSLPSVRGYELQLQQLFANLISNSLKFSEDPPVVTISYTVVQRTTLINVPHYLSDESYYEMAVADNGIGFEQEYAEQIFAMFKRLHGKHQFAGTGIGLALCKKIAENHNGYITARSNPGEGATFLIYLPVQTSI